MEEVEYRLLLRDEFSKALQGAKVHADQLEGSMGHLKSAVAGFIGIYAGFEVIKESISAFEGLSKANAQLEASLKSTKGAAGETTEDLAKQREELDKTSLSTESQISNMQALLLTFTSVHKDVFQEASGAIADMSAKMGSDMQSTTIQVGKALQDPIKGISALHRVGVNFSESQKDMIKHFVETGQAAKAQQLILHELETEFGGSAKAALDAAPMEAAKKEWEEVLVKIGGAVEKVFAEIQPFVKMVFDGIKSFVDFLEGHTTGVKMFATVVAGVAIAMKAQALWTAFAGTTFGAFATEMGLATAAEYAMETAQIALNAAMDANPIGIVVIAVAALVAGIIDLNARYDDLINSMDHAKKSGQDAFKKQMYDEVDVLMKQKGMTLELAEAQALASEKRVAMKAFEMARINELEQKSKMGPGGFLNLENVKNAIQLREGTQAAVEALNKKGIFADYNKDKSKSTASGLGIANSKPSEKVSGNNHTIINVSIAKLVETLKIESQNIKDGASMGAEHVTRALIASVNQFQASIDT